MSTEQSYVGRGNYATLPQKSAKKSQSKARPVKKRLPLHSPQPTPAAVGTKRPFTQKWQNSPLERLSELLAIKQQLSGSSVRLSGNDVRVKQRSSVSVQPQTTTRK